jgi:hypothetical protein
MKSIYPIVFLMLFSTMVFAENNTNIQIGLFSSGNIKGWQNKIFSGETNYQITQLDNLKVLKAESNSSASGLFKEQRIDLLKTPFLNWRWRIDQHLKAHDEQSKSGDDYSARIYVVVSGGWAFWKTKAINYVWTSQAKKNTPWPNAFAGKNAMMIAVRSTKDKTQTWYSEKRNILQDLKDQFGEDIQFIDAVAIMTDTDNTHKRATAYYGDIYFSKQ